MDAQCLALWDTERGRGQITSHSKGGRDTVAGSDMRHSPKRTARMRKRRGVFVAVLLLTSVASSAFAQNYSFDARRIALGGAAGTPNVASKLVEREAAVQVVRDPSGIGEGSEEHQRLLPESEGLRFLERRGVRDQAVPPGHRASRKPSRFQPVVRRHPRRPDQQRPECLQWIRNVSLGFRGRPDRAELGLHVHAAGGRPQLSGDLRRRRPVCRRARGLWRQFRFRESD